MSKAKSFSASNITLTWHQEIVPQIASGRNPSSSVAFRARIPHKKSRGGCFECKRKRIKCDEAKPHCGACASHRGKCEYPQNLQLRDDASTLSIVNKPALGRVFLMASSLMEMLDPCLPEPYRSFVPHLQDESIIITLKHFDVDASKTLANPVSHSIAQQKVPSLYLSASYLLNAVLAFSATHFHHFNPNATNYARAANCFGYRAVQLFSREINHGISVQNMDALFMTCSILGVLAFYTEEREITSSMIFSTDPNAANWLFIMSGFKLLIEQENITPHLSSSMYYPFIQTLSTDKLAQFGQSPVWQSSELYMQFGDLCRINKYSTVENNPYLVAVHSIMDILQLEANPENLPRIITYPATMTAEFAQLIREKDAAALVLLCYWLAKMCGVKTWWCQRRARLECEAICVYLLGWPDRRIQVLLELPREILRTNCWGL